MGERIIDIQDLVIEILLHWRGLILGIFIGGIVAASFSYANFIQSSKTLQERSRKLFKPEFPLFFHVLLFCFPPYPGKHFC